MDVTFDPSVHRYDVDGKRVDSVTQIIRSALGSPFANVADDVLELARQRGQAVHFACELSDAGVLDELSLDPRIVPYVDAWRAFRHDFAFRVLWAERPLYSALFGYAGTPDVVVEFSPRHYGVIDRKTGLPFGADLQTAGYSQLAGEEITRTTAEHDMPHIRRFALRMLATGAYRLTEYDAVGDWRDFLACLAVHRIKQRLGI